MSVPAPGPEAAARGRLFGRVASFQAGYYLITGLWPLVHMHSFEALTGPKRDGWLVRTVGLLLGAIGASLALGARRAAPETVALAAGSAASLAAIDVVYVARRRIRPVYLLDALAEVALLGGLLAGATRRDAGR